MWTGKQIFTSVLKNIAPEGHPGITLTSKSQTSGDRWGKASEEDQVIFHEGDFLCGILDKPQLGPGGGGLVHSVHEIYGPTVAGKLLSVVGRLLTRLLNERGFSCGVEDLFLTKAGNEVRRQTLRRAETVGTEIAAKYLSLDETKTKPRDEALLNGLQGVLRDEEQQKALDTKYNGQTQELSSAITKACLPAGLGKPFPRNNMQLMTTTGAKGSGVNANLISCNLGQQVLEGRRVPIMVSGKSLPSFKPFETSIRAGGYITDRFLTGLKVGLS